MQIYIQAGYLSSVDWNEWFVVVAIHVELVDHETKSMFFDTIV
jgi:hypothetical protein